MVDVIHVIGLVVGVLALTAIGLLLIAGIAFACVQRNQDGEL